jgi:hypothetical protein
MQVAQRMGSEGAPVLTAARQALVDAWTGSMWVGAGIAVVAAGLVLVLSLGKKGRQDMSAEGVLGELGEPADEAEEPSAADEPSATERTREPALASAFAAA